MKKYIILGLVMFVTTLGSAQKITIAEINRLADVMLQDTVLANRQSAFDSINVILPRRVAQSGITDLDSLKGMSHVVSDDGEVRLITFQLYKGPNEYTYGGFIWQGDRLIALKDQSGFMDTDVVYESHNADHWYGCLYYKILTQDIQGQKRYILLGYDAHSLWNKRKVLDVLTVDQKGDISLGLPCIAMSASDSDMDYLSRFVIEYSVQASCSLTYDTDVNLIVFDHLEAIDSPYKEQGTMMVPDGTYCGFKIGDKTISYVDKVYHQTQVVPFSEKPKKSRDKDRIDYKRSKKKRKKN